MKTRAETLRQMAFAFEQQFDLRFTDGDLNRRSLVSDANDLVQVVAEKGSVTRRELKARLLEKQIALRAGAHNAIGAQGKARASEIVGGALDVLSKLS